MTSTGPAEAVSDLQVPVTAPGRDLLARLAPYEERIRAEAGAHDRDGEFPFEAFKGFAEDGLLGGTVPAELGGVGVSRLYDVAVTLKRLAACDASTALALHVQFSRGLTLTYEWQHGPLHVRDMAERLLRSMATGEALVCGAVKDAPGTITELTADGHGNWLLSGRKTLVSMAPVGTHFFVHAQRQSAGRPVELVVPVLRRDTPGLSLVQEWRGLGMRASGTVDVAFDRCPVADRDVLVRGSVGAGDDVVLAGQTVSSVTMLGIYAGVAQAARDLAVTTAAGRSTAPPPAVRTLIAGVDAKLFALKASAGTALSAVDLWSRAVGAADPAERGRAMMTPFQYAKLMVNRLVGEIIDDCQNIVGGAAFSDDHPMARIYRDGRAGWFMQPYSFVDGVDYLSGQALGIERDNDYTSVRAKRARLGG
jgi:alkylation response protein AidB-like acyl-CoA dehydrogenase